jgi:hypothetical protein
MNDLDLVRAQLGSAFIFDADGTIVAHNDPPRTAADFKILLSGCAGGNIWHFAAGLDEARRSKIQRMFVTEPPLASFGQHPIHLALYMKVLANDAEPAKVSIGLNWHLPHDIAPPAAAAIVMSGTAEGDALLDSFRQNGVPPELVALGFTNTGEFWPPWCVVFEGSEIAALGFSARLGNAAADLGLVTVPEFRSRGFGSIATAAWAAHPALAHHTLFYSTQLSNLSSQRVTARLGLRFMGTTCRIG